MAKNWYPDPELRQYVIDWPVNEAKAQYRGYANVQENTLPHEHRGKWSALRHLVEHGYLTTHPNRNLTYVRTAKVMPPKRTVRRAATVRRYDGVFPWSQTEHWRQMCGSNFRLILHTLSTLRGMVGSTVQFPATIGHMQQRPVLVATKTMLGHMRHELEALFTKGQVRATSWSYQHLTLCFASPALLDALLADLLLAPSYDPITGKFVRFVERDATEARAVLERTFMHPLQPIEALV